MPNVTADGITLINFGMGRPNAATVMDLLSAISLETATIFAAGFANHIPTGALLLVSDQPMIPEGVKTEVSDRTVTANYVEKHLNVGIEALKLVRRHGRSVKHLRFESISTDRMTRNVTGRTGEHPVARSALP